MAQNIDKSIIPSHIAIIMDGNGRWAVEKGQDRIYGHQNAVEAVRSVIEGAGEIGVKFLTLFTFSSENWKRPNEEVNTLMSLISETLLLEAEEIFSKGLRLHVIGDIEKLPELVREQMQQLVNITKDNTRGNLILALSYGSQSEILNAVKKISSKVKSGELNEDEITEEVFENHLYTKDLPPVDLLIRTSGEVRISNFLLWQIAYAELQFLDILWPDFGKENFFQCVYDFQNKERRFGKTSEQLDENI